MVRTRIGFVGAGGIARRHLSNLLDFPDVAVLAVADPERERAEAQAARCSAAVYTGHEEMLAREALDALYICVPPFAHGAPEAAAVAAGLPFFVEKPIAADLETAERIGALLAERPLIAGVGYKWRALDTLPLVRELLAERPARMVLGAWHDTTPAPAWWRDERRSGGQIVEQATHLVDLARLLVGEAEVVAAFARQRPRAQYPDRDVAQVSGAVLRFADRTPGMLSATCLLEGRQAIQLQLVCEGRVITIGEQHLTIETGKETRQIRVIEDPFLREDEAFVRAVREGSPSLLFSSYANALKTHRLCCAIRSAAGR